MTNYNESAISGARWTRCRDIHIRNPYLGTPHIIFGEEDIISIENTCTHIARNQEIHADFEQEGSVSLINPTTGELTGNSMSHSEIYAILYSLYIQKAMFRDSQIPVA